MITQLSNDLITITVKHKGAELCSLKNKKSGIEYIWQGDPSFWGRHAPVLFPIVGKLKNDEYHHGGMSYNLSQHGFARDMDFDLIQEEGDKLVFKLVSDATTIQKYPFLFFLEISYQLRGASLIIGYRVGNQGRQTMYFSIGGHPAFNCPLEEGKVRENYTLHFSQKENALKHLLEEGLFSGQTKPVFEGTELPLTLDLFDEDALVFKGLESACIELRDGDRGMLRFYFEGFPYFGIWSKNRQSPFICLEPWYGLADHAIHNQDITCKEGIQSLAEGEAFDCEYQVEIL